MSELAGYELLLFEAYDTLETLFARCFMGHYKEALHHAIHLNCKSCRRAKMLRLRPLSNHNCGKFDGNLSLAHELFGEEVIKDMVSNEGRTHFFMQDFQDWMADAKFYDPHLKEVEFSYHQLYRDLLSNKSIMKKIKSQFPEENRNFYPHNKCDLCYDVRGF